MSSADLQVVCPALIGRESALAVLDVAIESVERPDSEGSTAVIIAGEAGIGTWTCRGWFYYDREKIASGAVPHVVTTQL